MTSPPIAIGRFALGPASSPMDMGLARAAGTAALTPAESPPVGDPSARHHRYQGQTQAGAPPAQMRACRETSSRPTKSPNTGIPHQQVVENSVVQTNEDLGLTWGLPRREQNPRDHTTLPSPASQTDLPLATAPAGASTSYTSGNRRDPPVAPGLAGRQREPCTHALALLRGLCRTRFLGFTVV